MKKFLTKWAIAYAIVNILFIVGAAVINNRLGLDIPYLRLTIGAAIISLLGAFSATIYKVDKLNDILRAILAFLISLPSVFILGRVFSKTIFRYSFIVYLLALVCAIIYAVAVMVVTKKFKNEEKALNELLRLKNAAGEREEDDSDSNSEDIFIVK
jgi:ABC-type transport system involved in cytochrome c biogenesis permease component